MRKIIAFILYVFFLPRIKKELKRKDSILAIYGHDQKREPFEQLVAWLVKKGYRFITPEELFQFVSGKKALDEKLVWLSFDDGWKSNYDNVFPVLKKYNIPATIFVATKGIADGYYWFTRAFQNRDSSLYNEVGDLWTMSNQERVKIIEQLPPYKGARSTMNPEEIREMTNSGLVHWGNHTHDHVMSDNCTDEELAEEIEKCEQIMKEITGKDCHFIYSYPNGNYDDRTVGVLKQMDFKMAVTTHIGRVFCPSDVYMIPRFEFKNGCLQENVLQCFGLWTRFFDGVKKVFGIKNKK